MTVAAEPIRASAPTRRRRMAAPVAVVGGLAAATLALHLRDPHEPGSWGMCVSAALGFSCPGCGGLRAVNDLTNLDVAAAASSNLLFVLSVPFVIYALVRWTHARWTGRPWVVPPRRLTAAAIALVTAMVLFAVVRNLPAGSWLAP